MSSSSSNKTAPSVQALSPNGSLASFIDGFQVREQQQLMAQAIENVIQAASRVDDGDDEASEPVCEQSLLVEAGTGTGKTFGYLVPCLLSGKKVVISTGTKNLQDQLFQKDLPTVIKGLKKQASTALLKGRANYLCLYRMALALEGASFRSPTVARDIAIIQAWSRETLSGDIAEVSRVAEDSQAWALVTSNTDNCLGQDCSRYNDCHVVKARRQAMDADIVVVNHHLFLADVALKEEGFGEVLPNVDVIILDEGHQIPDIATRFFGDSLSSRQLLELCRDVEQEYEQTALDMRELPECAEKLTIAVDSTRLAFPEYPTREAWSTEMKKPAMQQALGDLEDALDALFDLLKSCQDRSKGLESCFNRAQKAQWVLDRLMNSGEKALQSIAWFETFKKSFVLHLSPLSVAEQFAGLMKQSSKSWIFTSATLSIGHGFEHYANKLGLKKYQKLHVDSPFDYFNQALLYVPRYLPEVQSPQFLEQFVEHVLPLISEIAGGAFLLFTSHRALKIVKEFIGNRLEVPLLVQGESPKHQLIKQFKRYGNAVLLGTGSFWEGVDIRGAALSLVAIDKLPFASPSDPILKAQIKQMKDNQQQPFNELQLPEAVIALKQGVGRLIRDHTDKGVLVIGDNRLVTKEYAEMFIQSIPPMRRTRDKKTVLDFIQSINRT